MENSINEKPYIEYDGQKYEFEASFKLKREFDREIQSFYQQAIINKKLSAEKVEELKSLQEFINDNPEVNAGDLDDETIKKLTDIAEIIDVMSATPIYEKYCFKMLNSKYGIDERIFEKMLEGFANEYGMDKVDLLEQKVCEKVFTRQVESQEKKPLPSWMN